MARPVCVVASGGSPFVSVSDGPPATPVADGPPITLVEAGAPPICLVNDDGSAWFENVADADYGWDFIANQAIWNSASIGALANTPNWTFTRASTAYYTNSAGVLTSVASGVLRTGDRGALIEGARTNLCIRSQELDDVAWTKTACSVTANTTTAPDGTATADLLVEDGTTAQRYAQATSLGAYTVAATICGSVYFKQGVGSRNAAIRFTGVSGSAYVVFNPSDGSVVTSTATGSNWTVAVTPVAAVALGNGWYRGYLVAGHTETSGTLSIRATLVSGSTLSYLGDSASGIYFWGAQAEAASFPSSYIPTTTASATRAADSLTVTGVSGLGAALSGYHKIRRAADTGAVENYFQIDDGTDNNRIRMAVDASDRAELLVVAGGVTQAQIAITGAMAVNTEYGIAWRVGTNSAQICRSGTLGTEDTSVTVPTGLTTIRFGAGVSGANPANGNRAQDAIFTRSLSDAELQSIAAT